MNDESYKNVATISMLKEIMLKIEIRKKEKGIVEFICVLFFGKQYICKGCIYQPIEKYHNQSIIMPISLPT